MEDEDYNPPRNNKDKSREASILEVFTGFCHMEERFDQMLKANDEKWKILKRVDSNRINALTRLVKSQDKRIGVLETAHKKYQKGNLDEIMEINRQIYGNENRKQSNKAVGELKKTEEAVQAAQTEFDIWEMKKKLSFLRKELRKTQSILTIHP